jgi:hypothetical protein
MDTTKCGGASRTCAAGKYSDSTKAGTAIGSDAAAACCTSKATCKAFADAGKTGLTSGAQPIHIGLILAMASAMALLK